MSFAVSGFLLGLAFAVIPLLLHLIYRRKAPEVIFAATRFLKAATLRTARRRKIDNLLLLLLRTLLLGLLALGLAGPLLKRAAGTRRPGSDVVMVIDNSLSMAALEDGVARFTRAKEALDGFFSTLGDSDLVALVPTAPPDSLVQPSFSSDLRGARSQVARMMVSTAKGSMTAALESAATLIAQSAAAEKLLLILTDMQAKTFPEGRSLPSEVTGQIAMVPAIVYDCGGGAVRNVFLKDIGVRTQGAVVGTPVEVTGTVVSSSPVEETLSVALSVNDRKVQSRSVTVPPAGAVPVVLSTLTESPGIMEGSLTIETSDAINVDNQRCFALLVRNRITALILKKEHREPEFDDDAFFLRRALDPFPADPSEGRSPFDLAVRTYAEPQDMSGYDIVFLLLRGGMSADLAGLIGRYVASGGSLVVFPCDDEAAAGRYAWLPARLAGIKQSRRDTGESFAVTWLDTDDPALSAFAGEPPSLYNKMRVYSHWLVEPDGKGAKVIARLGDGEPAIVTCAAGAGQTALFCVAPIRSMSTLPASQFFLPLVYEISYHMVASSRGLSEVYAGEPAVLPVRPAVGASLVVVGPDGSRRVLPSPLDGRAGFDDTYRPGCYRIREAVQASDIASFAVNLDPAESDLARVESDRWGEYMPGRKVIVAASPAELERAVASLQASLALGDTILYAVLVVAVLECLAANSVLRESVKPK